MSNNGTLGSIRRRWWIVVIFVLLGALAGALPQPERVEERERTFSATQTLLVNDVENQAGANSAVSPNQVTLFVSTGEVPTRAADALGFSGNPASLAAQVTSEYDFVTGALTISSTQNAASQAELVADTFADELIVYLAERQDVIYQERLSASLDRLSALEDELGSVTDELARKPEDPVLVAQQSAISRQYSVAFEQSELLAASPPVLGFTTLQRAQAVEVTDRGLGAPTSRMSRGLLGGVVGAAVGIAVAAVLGQLDRRIRTKEQAEELLGTRSRVAIPKTRDKARDQLVVTGGRRDALADAYRTVHNLLQFVQSHDGDLGRAPITLVVSPGPGDGKTSLAANLAAATAESGRKTMLVNCDFRRPRLPEVFDLGDDAAVPFFLEDLDRLNATSLITATNVPRLDLFDLSGVDAPAGDLVRASVGKLDEITRLTDAVVVDTSPVGATAEVLELVPHADAIVIVARVGHTRVADAQRSIGILRDLTKAPILLVLGGLPADQSQYYEYEDRKKPNSETPRRWRRNLAPDADDGAETELEAVE